MAFLDPGTRHILTVKGMSHCASPQLDDCVSPTKVVAITFFNILFQRLFFPRLSHISTVCSTTYRRPCRSADSSFVITRTSRDVKRHDMRNEHQEQQPNPNDCELNKDKSADETDPRLPPLGFIPPARQDADTDPGRIGYTRKGLGVRSRPPSSTSTWS